MTLRDQIIEFYSNFRTTDVFSAGIQLHNPFDAPNRRSAIERFCGSFYDDDTPRVHLLGINPSRLTNSSTGVNYTDGFALQEHCGIPNDFSKSRELTSSFFYRVVESSGGAATFYNRVFAWAAMPVAITDGQNYANYYEVDDDIVKEIVIDNLKWISRLPSIGRLVILGSGDNKKYLESLPGFPFGYNGVICLPHPRWIMQYNKKDLDKHVEAYIAAIAWAVSRRLACHCRASRMYGGGGAAASRPFDRLGTGSA